MTEKECKNLAVGDIIKFPDDASWEFPNQMYEISEINESELYEFKLISYRGSVVIPSIGYWLLTNFAMRECYIVNKKMKECGSYRCPLCGSLGEDMVFAFYCSNENCPNCRR